MVEIKWLYKRLTESPMWFRLLGGLWALSCVCWRSRCCMDSHPRISSICASQLCQLKADIGCVLSLIQRPPTSALSHSLLQDLSHSLESTPGGCTLWRRFCFVFLHTEAWTCALLMTFSCYGALLEIVCAITITITITFHVGPALFCSLSSEISRPRC